MRLWFLHNFTTRARAKVEHGVSFVACGVCHLGGSSSVRSRSRRSRCVVRWRQCRFVGRRGIVVGTWRQRRLKRKDHQGRARGGGIMLGAFQGLLGRRRRGFTGADDNRRYNRPQQETAAPGNQHGGGSSCG